MRAKVKWLDHMTLVGESSSGHALVMDAAPEVGGRNLGARPMEMVLLGLGGCTAIDVVSILKKARQPVTGCEVQLEATRSDGVPRVFTAIALRYRVSGSDLSEKQVSRAVSLSSEKYCSVSRMLEPTVQLRHSYEIVDYKTIDDRGIEAGAGAGTKFVRKL